MPLRPLPFREVRRTLEAVGFELVSQKGSHVKFAKTTPQGREVVRKLALRLGKAARAAEGRK